MADDDAPARRDVAPRRDASTTSRPRPTSTTCSKRSRTSPRRREARLERARGGRQRDATGLGLPRRGRLLDREQHVQHVVRELAARAMRPARADASTMSASPMPRPTRTWNRSGTSSQRSDADRPEADLPVEPIRVAEAQRPGRPVDLEMRCARAAESKDAEQAADDARLEGQRAEDRRRHLRRDRRAGEGPVADRAARSRRRARPPPPPATGPSRDTSAVT